MNDFLKNLAVRYQRFMIGRNGPDALAFWSLIAAVCLSVINAMAPMFLLSLANYGLLIYVMFRIFSRNVEKRRAEDAAFRRLLGKPGKWMREQREKRDAVYFRCDQCNQKLFVPRGKGRLRITCPKCGHQQEIDS